MANGLAIVTGVSGTGTVHSPSISAGATATVTGIVAQGFVGALTTTADGRALPTGVVATGVLSNITATPTFFAPVTGVQATGAVGTVSTRGSNFKTYLHPYVYNQIPEYIREQYPLFVQFVEGYYRYLDSPNNPNDILLNSGSWTDVDSTLEAFVTKLRTQFASDFPNTTIVDGRRFIKQVHEFYEAKGTERSIEMFFKILYRDEVAIEYPSKNVLRASDGKWRRDTSLKLNVDGYSGNKTFVYFADDYTLFQGADFGYVFQVGNNSNPFDLIGTMVIISFWETVPGVGRVQRRITTDIIDVKKTLNPLIYELITNIDPTTIILDGALVEFGNLVYGTLTRQYLTYKVITAGEGFEAGDVLYVNEEGLVGEYFAESYLINQDTSLPSAYVASNFLNNGVLRVSTVDEDGGITLASIINTGYLFNSPIFQITLASSHTITPALVEFTTGFIYQHQGYFVDASGLLSDTVKLQDNFYYQPYSYVIKSKIDPTIWKDAYLKAVHPAGIKMFSEFITTEFLDFRASVLATDDTRQTFRASIDVLTMADTHAFVFNKVVSPDSVSMSDTLAKDVGLTASSDSVSMGSGETVVLAVTVAPSDDVTTSDVFDREVTYFRSFVDTPITSEDVQVVTTWNRTFADSAINSDSISINTSTVPTDSATTSDSGVGYVQNFNDPDYNEPGYTGTIFTF